MNRTLARLVRAYPLAPRWGTPILYAERACIGGASIWMCGLVVRDGGRQATGSAAGFSETQLARAYFELLERTSVLEAMERTRFELMNEAGQPLGCVRAVDVFQQSEDEAVFRYSRSNGVAAARNWKRACRAAWFELVERDRVLAAWYGEIEPRQVAFEAPAVLEGVLKLYDMLAYAFDFDVEHGNPAHVRGVFAFPRTASAPLSYGFAARSSSDRAVAAAARECVQRLAFLWGEPIPMSEPSFSPTPEFHQDFFLWPRMHPTLRAWLEGGHSAPRASVARSATNPRKRFVDLTPAHLSDRLRVVRALPSHELPLVFGRGHPAVKGDIPPELMVHPIP